MKILRENMSFFLENASSIKFEIQVWPGIKAAHSWDSGQVQRTADLLGCYWANFLWTGDPMKRN